MRGRALRDISYSFAYSKRLAEPDEELELVAVITNESRRIVPFISLEESLPKEINVLHKDAKLRPGGSGGIKHCYSVYLMPRSTLERRVSVSFPKRGLYRCYGAEMVCGDFLGLSGDWKHFHSIVDIVIYPGAASFEKLESILGGFFGDMSVRRFIMEDPVLTVGAREYTGAEPFRQISWNHSARTARLMVKQFDYTVEPIVSVVLDVNTLAVGDERERLIEHCFSLARSVCEMLERKGIPYDFISNATTGNALSVWSYIGEGLGNAHLFSILEGLGRASLKPRENFTATIEKMKRNVEGNRSVICIMPERNAEKQQLAQSLTELRGGALQFIYGEDVNDLGA